MDELQAPLPWCAWKKKWKVEGAGLLGVGGELHDSIQFCLNFNSEQLVFI